MLAAGPGSARARLPSRQGSRAPEARVDTTAMDAGWEPISPARGPARLLADCATLERLGRVRPSARDRLQHLLGCELAGFLLRALSTDQRGRSRELLV